MQDCTFSVEKFTTQSGATLDLLLAYRIYGKLSPARDNLIVFPTYYAGGATENEYLIGPGRALDPATFCVVVPNLIGNGASTSPSNAPMPWAGSRFPRITYFDNVACQHHMIQSVFDTEKIFAVVGFSMGAQQAYQWVSQYPDAVDRFVAICGTARTAEHNQLCLDSLRSGLIADNEFKGGNYDHPPTRGLEAFSTIYASWVTSQQFFANRLYRQMGMEIDDLSGFVHFMKQFLMRNDANDLLTMAATWRAGDPSMNDHYKGDFKRAMRSIRARGLVMPCDTDLFFRVSDCETEVALLVQATLEPIHSDFGHAAGGGFDPLVIPILNASIRAFLEG